MWWHRVNVILRSKGVYLAPETYEVQYVMFLCAFADDLLDVVERAVKVGVKKVIPRSWNLLHILSCF